MPMLPLQIFENGLTPRKKFKSNQSCKRSLRSRQVIIVPTSSSCSEAIENSVVAKKLPGKQTARSSPKKWQQPHDFFLPKSEENKKHTRTHFRRHLECKKKSC
ncbi:hypothetical protein ACFX13_048125 [Malus domestica]